MKYKGDIDTLIVTNGQAERVVTLTDRELLELVLEKIGSIETDVSTVKSELHTLKTEQQVIKSVLHTIKSEQQIIKSEQQVIKLEQEQIKLAVLETNESVKRLETIQESQNRIIELLSARSLQQEAEIKRIK